jgi:hypothetical protein
VPPTERHKVISRRTDPRRQSVMRLAVYGCLVFLGLMSVPLPTIARDAKVVPILSVFNHWDHHWYIWLPGDPVYEAVEVMSRERGVGASPLVWVFFTERVAPKRQVHYFLTTPNLPGREEGIFAKSPSR